MKTTNSYIGAEYCFWHQSYGNLLKFQNNYIQVVLERGMSTKQRIQILKFVPSSLFPG